MNKLFLLSILAASLAVALSAVCGSTEYFEYSFEPISVSPTKPEDVENSKKRCGEKTCDIVIALNGEDRCKTNDHSDYLAATKNKNQVSGSEFTPSKVDFKVHNNWKLSDAKNAPVKIEVCDKDNIMQGRNDELIKVEKQSLQSGCHEYQDQDTDPEHPWSIKYKICCRPIGEETGGDQGGQGGSSGSGGRGSSWHGSKGDRGGSSIGEKGRSGSFSGGAGGVSDTHGSRTGGLDRDRSGSIGGTKGDSGSVRDSDSRDDDDDEGGLGSRGSSTRSHTKGDFNGDRGSTGGRGSSRGSSIGSGSRGSSGDSFGGGSSRTVDWSSRDRDRDLDGIGGSRGGSSGSSGRYELKGEYESDIGKALGTGPGTTREKLERYKAKGGNVRDLLKGDLKDRYDRLFGGKGETFSDDIGRGGSRSYAYSSTGNRYNSDRYLGSAGTGDYDYGKWRSKYRS